MTPLGDALEQLIVAQPERTARELVWELRAQGRQVTKKDLNPVLYNDARFVSDGAPAPRWRLVRQVASRLDHATRTVKSKEKRHRLDQVQSAVAGSKLVPDLDYDALAAQLVALGLDIDVAERLASMRDVIEALDTDSITVVPAGTRGEGPARRSRTQDGSAAPTTECRPHRPREREPEVREPWQVSNLRPWQHEALTAWFDYGAVGICEAVTGTGKTHLGLEAVAQSMARGQRSTVLVPSVLLQRQWELRLEEFVPLASIAKLGGATSGDPRTADVVIAVVNSALTKDVAGMGPRMELLVADEVHRYGGEGWSTALRDGYTRRLGLTATLERGSDDGVNERLLPYFDRVVLTYGYDRATAEKVVAPFDLLFLGVDLTDDESAQYQLLSRKITQARKVLLGAGGSPATLHQQLGSLRSMGGDVTRAVMAYEKGTRERRRMLAQAPSKQDALQQLADFVDESDGTVIFTDTENGAVSAAETLQGENVSASAVFGSMPARQRQELISALGDGAIKALAAPKILDEGIDVPDVNLGIVLAGSSSRRQMIQRLGRVIRLKPDGGRARFVILFVNGTIEDPDTGAREDFVNEVQRAADVVMLLHAWEEDDLSAAWAGALPPWELDRAGDLQGAEPVTPSTSSRLSEVGAAPAVKVPRVPSSRRIAAPSRPHEVSGGEAEQLLSEIQDARDYLRELRLQGVGEVVR